MRDELLSSVGAQDMDTSGYQESDLDDVDCYWENDQLNVVTVFRPGMGAPFFNDFEMGLLAENRILIDDGKTRRTVLLQQH